MKKTILCTLPFAVTLFTACTPTIEKIPEERKFPPSAVAETQCPKLEIGDVVFTRCDNLLYRQVANATGSWTSHVGVIVSATPGAEIIAESTVPFAKLTPLKKFIARSENGAYAVRRPTTPLTDSQKQMLSVEALDRLGITYHLGFKLSSKRQFCSKLVWEVYKETCGYNVGKVETFRDLITKNPETSQWFWYLWYGGFIPWDRTTVTPASQYESDKLKTIFDNHIECVAQNTTL